MIIYLAGLVYDVLKRYVEIFPGRKLSVLRSFGRPSKENSLYYKNSDTCVESMVLDSGVYTMNTTKHQNGIRITLKGYRDYVKSCEKHFDHVFNFDSEFEPNGISQINWHNQQYLEEAGIKPIPVIHDIYKDEVDFYIDQGYKLIAIGSMQVKSVKSLIPVVKKLYKAGVKIHLFGTTKIEILRQLPIYSCDSSTWTREAAMGTILYWNPQKPGFNKTDKISFRRYQNDELPKTYFNEYEYQDDLVKFLRDTFDIEYSDLIGYDWCFTAGL